MDLLLDRIGDFVEILAWNKAESFYFGIEYELNDGRRLQGVFPKSDAGGSIFNKYRPLIEELGKLSLDTFQGAAKPMSNWSEHIGRYRVEFSPEPVDANSKGVAVFGFVGNTYVTA